MEGENMQMPAPGKSNGPVVGIIVVIIVLAIGAYYLYAELQSQKMMRDETLQESTEVSDIEADVSGENLDTLDAELDADLQELDSEVGTQ